MKLNSTSFLKNRDHGNEDGKNFSLNFQNDNCDYLSLSYIEKWFINFFNMVRPITANLLFFQPIMGEADTRESAAYARFPALGAGCSFIRTRVLIGSLHR